MKINFYEHNIKDQKIFKRVLKSTFLTSGPICKEVEKKIANRFSKKNCLLTNSWTNAVIGILKSLDLKAQDEVIIPNLTFVACANVVEITGAKVIFADVDKNTLLLSIDDCIKKITKKTKVIMPVHLYGNIFDTEELKKQIKKKTKKKIYIIEDSAHSFSGACKKNKPIGHYADFAVFSFYATKNITCGEGGAIITNNVNQLKKIKSMLINGMSQDAQKRFTKSKYNFWDVKKPGLKGNLSDINASLLLNQINNNEKNNVKKRKKIFDYYKKNLKNLVDYPLDSIFKFRDYHLFPIGLKNKKIRNLVIRDLFMKRIPVTINYKAISELKYYKKKYAIKDCRESIKWGNRTLSLPLHLNLNFKQLNFIIKNLKNIIFKYY
jgi:dTDP-4-amino-4,6-dideoxygalactose transaminase